ncbi:hypothetical protein [Sorangium cellulosum]|uniref:Uncharacterized protein n=1 Tax=Sorangium cellulosum So0157-2 TaxID=1254432 RepID=S4XXH5_SORCE|nr:hypothetical protein [Sorangium cellulosum]AGP35318.1 hypothetical protein SCE1572_12795 [Sorangium cellulosum So0157-2]
MRHRFPIIATLTAVSLLLTASARAADGEDEVTLKNGGTIRGTVVASEPGESVKIIELGEKEVRVIPWSQVSDVERGKFAPKSAAQPGAAGPGYGAAPPPQPVPAPEPTLGAPGVVRLHVDSPTPVRVLEEASTTYGAYGGYGFAVKKIRPVCVSPCDKVIDGSDGRKFSLSPEDMPPPDPFTFAQMTGDVTLHVDPGSYGRRTAASWLNILGLTAAVTGGTLWFVSSVGTDVDSDPSNDDGGGALKTVGIVSLIGGGAALAGGIVLWATSGTSVTLEQHGEKPAGKAARVKPRYWLGEF